MGQDNVTLIDCIGKFPLFPSNVTFEGSGLGLQQMNGRGNSLTHGMLSIT